MHHFKITWLSVIISCYKSPWKELLKKNLDQLFNNNNSVIVCGDLNSKHSSWNDRKDNPNGKILGDRAENNGIFFLL
jgi:exonuclease III